MCVFEGSFLYVLFSLNRYLCCFFFSRSANYTHQYQKKEKKDDVINKR